MRYLHLMQAEGKSRFRKVNDWLHLWLGLISGIIVFIVCITGCIWVFNEEINWLLQPEYRIAKSDQPILLPSQIEKIAAENFPDQRVESANYSQDRAIEINIGKWDADQRYSLYVHPYTGKVLGKETHLKGETDFFGFILDGHRFLWLPWKIGRPIVNYATMVFVFILITGLIWWYPKKWTKTNVKKSFSIKWNASFKRLNIDLHNVFGFYAMLVLLAIALTGMVWGIEWYSQGLYWVTSGGKSIPEWADAQSDTTQAGKQYTAQQAMDLAWGKTVNDFPTAQGFYYSFPDTTDAKSVIYLYIYPSNTHFYNSVSYSFDRHTLAKLPGNEVYDASFDKASFATKLRKMNYDIHVGSILGFPGKVLAFLAALIGASLPITGFLIWWNRKFADKGKPKKVKKNTNGQQAPRAKIHNRPQIKKPAELAPKEA